MADDLPPLVDMPAPKKPAVTIEAPSPDNAMGLPLPHEADALYGRIRKAEGTEAGDGFVFYGGQSFKPGKDFPEWEGAKGPKGTTHAAGPGQWQPDTWNGLKPDFEKRFGRAPDFSSQDDQKAMSWLNAAKIYPGGEEKLKADIAAGKLNEAALAPQWAGFGGGGDMPPAIASGKWRVSDKALAYEQGRSNTSVVWMSPDDYLAMTPQTEAGDKRKSLMKSLAAGDEIEAIPTLDAKIEKGRIKVFDQDGRNRARVAKEEGVDLIPVAIHGVAPEAGGQGKAPARPDWIEDMNGALRRFNYTPVPKATPPAPSRLDRFGTGLADVGYGAAQLGGHIAAVPEQAMAPNFGMVPPETAKTVDTAVADREKQIEAERAARGESGTDWWRVAGNVAGTMPLAAIPVPGAPVAGAAGTAARIGGAAVRGALGGAEGAALAPVTSGDYETQKAKQIGEGAALGAAVPAGAGAVGATARAATNAAGRVVSPNIVTQAASRLFGEDAKALTPELLARVKANIQAKFNRIEGAHDIHIDDEMVRELGEVQARAIDMLGDTEAKPISDALERILERARGDGIIPARSAATLWHKGSRLDNLTEAKNPDIAILANRAQSAVRNALSRQLSPEEAAEYSLARGQWRDFKIVANKTLRPGETQLDPRRFVNAVARRFPEQAAQPGGPEVLRLARAVGETWPAGRQGVSLGPEIAGLAAGHAVGGPFGGAIGAILGNAVRSTVLDRLAGMRVASPNAMLALRPPPPVAPPNKGLEMLRALGQRSAGPAIGAVSAAPGL